MFQLHQEDKSLSESYSTFTVRCDELNQYHPSKNNLEILKQKRESLKFPSLSHDYTLVCSQLEVRFQLVMAILIPTGVYFHLLRPIGSTS